MLAETAELEAVGRKGIQFRSLLAISTGSLSPNLVRLSLISGESTFYPRSTPVAEVLQPANNHLR